MERARACEWGDQSALQLAAHPPSHPPHSHTHTRRWWARCWTPRLRRRLSPTSSSLCARWCLLRGWWRRWRRATSCACCRPSLSSWCQRGPRWVGGWVGVGVGGVKCGAVACSGCCAGCGRRSGEAPATPHPSPSLSPSPEPPPPPLSPCARVAGPPSAQRPGQDHHRHQQQPRPLPHHQPLLRLPGAGAVRACVHLRACVRACTCVRACASVFDRGAGVGAGWGRSCCGGRCRCSNPTRPPAAPTGGGQVCGEARPLPRLCGLQARPVRRRACRLHQQARHVQAPGAWVGGRVGGW